MNEVWKIVKLFCMLTVSVVILRAIPIAMSVVLKGIPVDFLLPTKYEILFINLPLLIMGTALISLIGALLED